MNRLIRVSGLIFWNVAALCAQGGKTTARQSVPARGEVRIPISGDSGRGLRLWIARDSGSAKITASLFEPGRIPSRSSEPLVVGLHLDDTPIDIDASDMVTGKYELVVAGDAVRSTGVAVSAELAPVRLHAALVGSNIRLTADNLTDSMVAVRFRVGLLGAATNRHITHTDATPIRLAFPLPTWVSTLVLDTSLPDAERSRFSDFQIAVASKKGAVLGNARAMASFTRTNIGLSARSTPDSLIITLRPKLVTPVTNAPWTFDLQVRYEGQAVEIDPGGSPARSAARGASATETFPMRTAVPRPIPSGFDPVVQMVAMDPVNDWWRLVRLTPVAKKP